MLLCIDVGNTNIVMGVANQDRILAHWRIRTEKEATSDEMGITIGDLLRSSGIRMEEITDIIISCVVPSLLNVLEELSNRYFRIRPMIVGPGLDTGFPIQYDNPKEVGADRFVNAVAAYDKYV